ncbi:MAG: DUF1801 domain-containing protein [Oscillospiraceae bacterium]
MYEAKTKPDATNAADLVAAIQHPQRRADAEQLLQIFGTITGSKPVVWAGKMVGFGSYTYRYASGHSGQAFNMGFAPAKGHTTVYLYLPEDILQPYMQRLGKAKSGKACIYINKSDDVDIAVLQELIKEAKQYVEANYDYKW